MLTDLREETHFVGLEPKPWPEQWTPSADFPTPQSATVDEFSRVANNALSFSHEPVSYRVGEADLPVAPYRKHFLEVVKNNQSVVVSSETGSGKSSQLGLYLLEDGAPRVFITQPRIIAARELTGRARYNLGPDNEHLQGYLTGNQSDSDCGPDARLIYVTEQLLFKMANRGELGPNDVVINDEAHEQTIPTVYLLGLMKKLQQDNPGLKLIISSATINTDKFARYLANPQTGEPAPVLVLPGRTHPIVREESEEEVAQVMRQQMSEGKNVLAFVPGVTRMRTTRANAQMRKSNETVHVLYGDQSPTEQKTALIPDDHNHIVATRIGETSITPQGKDVVVDSGLSNVGRYTQGVRGLQTIFSSKDTLSQRAGRVGRTKPGTYILATPDNAPPPPAYEDRPDYEDPAIQNGSVTGFIAELLSEGRKNEDLDLLDDPTHENLQYDYLVLKRLGATAMKGEDLVLTPIGEEIIDLPLDISLARMVVESRSLELGDDGADRTALRLQVAAAAAVRQVKGILDVSQYSARRYLKHLSNKESLSNEQSSNVLFELDVFATLYAKQRELGASNKLDTEAKFERILTSYDILPNRYIKALRTFEELCRRDNLDPEELQKPDIVQRKHIVSCQIAGAEEVFVRHGKQAFRDIRGENRTMGRQNTIALPTAELLVGVAFDYEGLKSSGRHTRSFVTGASAVKFEQLRAHAPHRLTELSSGHFITRSGSFVEKKTHYFDGELKIADTEEAPSPNMNTREALIAAMMMGAGRSIHNPQEMVAYNPATPNATAAIRQWNAAQALEHRSSVNLNTVNRYASLIKKIVRQSVEAVPLDVIDPAQLDDLIPKIYLNSLVRPTRKRDVPEIIRLAPDSVSIPVREDEKEHVPVTYRNNIAYVTLTREQISKIKREDFAHLLQHHAVKLRVGSSKYQQFEAAFAHIDELRQARADKQERREQNRQIAATNLSLEKGPSVERERAPMQDIVKEASSKAINIRTAGLKRKRAAQLIYTRRGDLSD